MKWHCVFVISHVHRLRKRLWPIFEGSWYKCVDIGLLMMLGCIWLIARIINLSQSNSHERQISYYFVKLILLTRSEYVCKFANMITFEILPSEHYICQIEVRHNNCSVFPQSVAIHCAAEVCGSRSIIQAVCSYF